MQQATINIVMLAMYEIYTLQSFILKSLYKKASLLCSCCGCSSICIRKREQVQRPDIHGVQFLHDVF